MINDFCESKQSRKKLTLFCHFDLSISVFIDTNTCRIDAFSENSDYWSDNPPENQFSVQNAINSTTIICFNNL